MSPSIASAPLRARRVLALAPLLGLAAACGGSKPPSISLRLAGPSMPVTNRCGDPSVRAGEPVPSEITKLRVTLRSHAADGSTIAFCDSVFDHTGVPPSLRVPADNATTLDAYVEAYSAADATDPAHAGGLRRIATGSLVGIDALATTVGPLRLYGTERFRCAGALLGFPRAFHTATRLPDGRVLFVGGLVGSATDPAAATVPMGGSTAIGSAELYDPRDQSMVTITEPTAPVGRAFHSAFLLDSSSMCPSGALPILLVGGLGPATPAARILDITHGLGGRLIPFTGSPIATPLAAHAVGNELLCLDADNHAATRVPVAGDPLAFSAAGTVAHGLAVSGGIDYDPNLDNTEVRLPALDVFPRDGSIPVLEMLGAGRNGATLTALAVPGSPAADDNTALVWGGGLFGDPVGEVLTGLDGASPTSSAIPQGGALATQFHTATLLGGNGTGLGVVLMTGGFEISSGGANIKPPTAARAVRAVNVDGAAASEAPIAFGGSYVSDTTCMNPARYLPAGWESAVALDTKHTRVLVTGGTPSASRDVAAGLCADCPGTSSVLCAIGQASIYDGASGKLSPAGDALVAPRFGHTSTVLLDGSILIAGGIGSDQSANDAATFIPDLEVYDPSALVPIYDVTVGGIDPDDPIADELTKDSLQRAPDGEITNAILGAPTNRCSAL